MVPIEAGPTYEIKDSCKLRVVYEHCLQIHRPFYNNIAIKQPQIGRRGIAIWVHIRCPQESHKDMNIHIRKGDYVTWKTELCNNTTMSNEKCMNTTFKLSDNINGMFDITRCEIRQMTQSSVSYIHVRIKTYLPRSALVTVMKFSDPASTLLVTTLNTSVKIY